MMQITIRSQRLLRWLGFRPAGRLPMVVGLSVRGWLEVIAYKLKGRT